MASSRELQKFLETRGFLRLAVMIERLGNHVRINPSGPLNAAVRPPGSKSLTNRALFCAALAHGRSTIRGASIADDAQRMLDGLNALGIATEFDAANATMHVAGCGGHLPAETARLDVGPAGTAMRFLTALLCVGDGEYRIDGAPRMRERPIGPLVDALRALGAQIEYEQREGYPPLRVDACGLHGGDVEFDRTPSSQFVSALLMAAPHATSDARITISGALPSEPYVAMTLEVMRAFGLDALDGDGRFVVPAPQHATAASYEVEPDASAAAYFWAAAAITGGRVRVDGLTAASPQGDVRFVEVLQKMGCQVTSDAGGLAVSGPPAGGLRGVDVDLNAMPDTAQTLAVVALFASDPTTIRNVANLRIKETDRIAALAKELAKFGARVETADTGLTIHPPRTPTPAEVDTYDDHRMAMSFSLAGLRCGATIRGAECVSKSYPAFFEDLGKLLSASARD